GDGASAVVAHEGRARRFVRPIGAVDDVVAHGASRDLHAVAVKPRIEGEAVGVVLVFTPWALCATVTQGPPRDSPAVLAVPDRAGVFVAAVRTIRMPAAP